MARIIGVNSLHIAEVTSDTVSGTQFGTPKAVPSLMSIDINDNTESVTFYSDDTTEQVINAFAGKEVTITLGYISNELEAELSGNTYKNGVFIQNANNETKNYAIMFRAPLSKGGYQYVCLYKGVLARTESNYATKEDSVEGQTVTLTGVFMPLQSSGDVSIKANSTDTGNEALISKWFTQVPVVSGDRSFALEGAKAIKK